jgi:hypothetical protein
MRHVDTGFLRENMLVASVRGGPMEFYTRVVDEVQRLPGVVSVALADSRPLGTHTEWSIFLRPDPRRCQRRRRDPGTTRDPAGSDRGTQEPLTRRPVRALARDGTALTP